MRNQQGRLLALGSWLLALRSWPTANNQQPTPNSQQPTVHGPCRAYTLLELLIVVSLLGLAGALLVPYLIGRTTLETQAAVRMIIADLHYAQSDSTAHQEVRRVYFYDDGSGYCLLRLPPGSDFDAPFDPATAVYVPDETTKSGHWIVNFSENDRFSNVTISAVEIDGDKRYVSYDSLGGTIMSGGNPGVGGVIEVKSPEATYRITIAPFTGRLTVERIE